MNRLVGVYITTSPLDQFDADAFLDDYIQQALTGESVAVDDSQYAEKLYGNLVEGEDGPYYAFEGVEGFPFYTLNINRERRGKLTAISPIIWMVAPWRWIGGRQILSNPWRPPFMFPLEKRTTPSSSTPCIKPKPGQSTWSLVQGSAAISAQAGAL